MWCFAEWYGAGKYQFQACLQISAKFNSSDKERQAGNSEKA